jgi:hypothetical protein
VLELSNEHSFDLYKIAVEEYRFQVKLNWDRTAYHLTLSSGLIAIAVGLLKVGSAPIVNLFVAGIFLIGLLASLIGIKTICKGHGYYRRTVVKKTLLEDHLGLNKPLEGYEGRLTPAISTTTSQNEQFQILHNTDDWLKRSLRGSITGSIVFILILFCVVNALGVAGSLWLYAHPPANPQSPPGNRISLSYRGWHGPAPASQTGMGNTLRGQG